MSDHPEKNVAITGVGQSAISRGAPVSALSLTIDAVLEAIADAGLTRADIDGISCWPGPDNDTSGFAPVGIQMLQDALRLELNWYSGGREAPGQFGATFNAIGAITAGLARHVIVYRTLYEATARQTSYANSLIKNDQPQANAFRWFAPYYFYSAISQQSLFFTRYVHESGIREEQAAQIALNGRRNAMLNPKALYRTPLTLEDYLASPIISSPLRMYDCDVPCDGATAIVLSRVDEARDMPNPVIRFEAVGSAMKRRNSWDQHDALAEQVLPTCAEMMWSRTSLTPDDVDFCELYDGFSYHSIISLEALGFCKPFEGGEFIGDGSRISLSGALPINTNGGALSAGRLHAYGQVHEACTQLWGRAGARQIPGRDVRVAALTTAGGPLGGCMLLVRD